MDFLDGLNPQQRKAVLHVDGPLLLLAGAGSGKTRVITHRMAHLVSAHGVPGPAILAVTFTNKAAGEMRERTMKLLGEASARRAPFVSTFHSFCVRLLRRDGASLATIRPGFTTSFNIYDDADQLSIVKSVFRHLGIDEKFMQYRAALSRISHAKNHKETPEDFYKNATDPKAERMAVIFDQYEGKLRQANALDFDDLLLESVRLLRNDTMIREEYNRRFEFVMIDEYQDTNRTQYEMMRLLTEVRENVAVVGDEDQSIYGWRGADIKNILDFQKDFPKASVIRLEQNYRSVKNILEAAGAVVSNNRERLGKNLWTDAGAGDKITVFEAMDGEQEALYIADNVERELGRNPRNNVAVLYRTNFQSRQIEEALRRYNRKYVVVGGLSFYDRAEVKDMLCYLKVLLNPNDSVSLERIINVPARGIGKTTFEQIEKYAAESKLAVWPALIEMLEKRLFPGRAEAAVSAFARLTEELREGLEQRPVHETLNLILDRTGYRRMIETEQTPEAENRIGNLVELVNAAADGSERGETLADFLDHAALVADADSVDEKSQVSLLTIHNAKGLEWPVVFLAGMEEGLFPHSRSRESETHLEEERRLCYVALTRAEKKLYLTSARYRRRYGGGAPEASIPSRFLAEIPRELTQKANANDIPQVNLRSEQWEVRESVKKNLFTGKTYNSVDNISQFFADRGMPAPRAFTPPPAQATAAPAPPRVAPPVAPAPPVAKKASPGGGQMSLLSGMDEPVTPTRPVVSRPTAASAPPVARQVPQPVRQVRPAPAPLQSHPQAKGSLTYGTVGGSVAGKPGGQLKKKPFGPGSYVDHPRYGRGTVLKREGDGDDAKLTISFPGIGLKKLVEKFAGLKVE
ncbi:hypothetical protein F183_A44110 [Bryobacterales bacterium F-183]|nr:hypothetical protein F183_A44110 [Bryobacterales bacterium F-183]